MSLPVILRPEAQADIHEIRDYLEEQQVGLSERFDAELRKLLERIEDMPELFALAWEDVRAVRLNKFRYVLYYVVFPDRAEVLAVMHGAREPGLWRSRRN